MGWSQIEGLKKQGRLARRQARRLVFQAEASPVQIEVRVLAELEQATSPSPVLPSPLKPLTLANQPQTIPGARLKLERLSSISLKPVDCNNLCHTLPSFGVVSGLEQAETEAMATELQKLGIAVRPFWGDSSETPEIERLFHETVTTFGRLDLLVNDAGSVVRTSFFKVNALLLERQLG